MPPIDVSLTSINAPSALAASRDSKLSISVHPSATPEMTSTVTKTSTVSAPRTAFNVKVVDSLTVTSMEPTPNSETELTIPSCLYIGWSSAFGSR